MSAPWKTYRVSFPGLRAQLTVRARSVGEAADEGFLQFNEQIAAGEREEPKGLPVVMGVFDYAEKVGYDVLTEAVVERTGWLSPDGKPPQKALP